MKKRFCTLYECVQLLIALSMPVAIGIYTVIQYNNEQAIAEKNRRQDLVIANETRIKDLSIAENNRQIDLKIAADVRANDIAINDDQQKEDLLIKYQYFVANLLATNDKKLSTEISYAIHFKTLATLSRLNAARKISLIQSLYDVNLIKRRQGGAIISLASADLTNINFSITITTELNYPCIAFDGAMLNNASFRHANIDGASFKNGKLNNADFAYSIGANEVLDCTNIGDQKGIDFCGAQMYRAKFTKASYVWAHFGPIAMIDEANFYGFKCIFCDFRKASLIRANFTEALIQGTGGTSEFTSANMTEACLYKARFQGVDLSSTTMLRVNGTEAEFQRCSFISARFVNSSFNQGKIIQSNMIKANLTGAYLRKSNLTEVKFISTDLHHVNMQDVYAYKCNFTQANFTNANLNGGVFIENDFTTATLTDQQLASAKTLQGSILPNRTVT